LRAPFLFRAELTDSAAPCSWRPNVETPWCLVEGEVG